MCFPAEFLTWFLFVLVSLFGVRSAHFGWFFQDTSLSTVVAGFFRSNSLQLRSCQFFTLGTWPTRSRKVTPWTGACGSRFVFQGAAGGFSVDPRSFGRLLLQMRFLVATRVLYTLLLTTVLHNANPDFWLLFRVVFCCFFSFLFTVCLCDT